MSQEQRVMSKEPRTFKKALAGYHLATKKFDLFDFDGAFFEMLGNPEKKGVWVIYGDTGSGKTSFCLQLLKYLAQFEDCLYNSLEQGMSYTMISQWKQNGLINCKNVFLLDSENMNDLDIRLKNRKSQRIVIIDSIQYTGLSFSDYVRFKNKHKNKLLIFISQADGNKVSGAVAKRVVFDADCKIYCEGYKAFSKGRYIGATGEYTIWEKGAFEYYGS